MNLETMNHLELFKNLGFPVLLGTSRKSMIGLALDLPVDQRVEGTLATSVIGVMKAVLLCVFMMSRKQTRDPDDRSNPGTQINYWHKTDGKYK